MQRRGEERALVYSGRVLTKFLMYLFASESLVEFFISSGASFQILAVGLTKPAEPCKSSTPLSKKSLSFDLVE